MCIDPFRSAIPFLICCAIASGCAVSPFHLTRSGPVSDERLMEIAQTFESQGRFGDARDVYEVAAKRNPGLLQAKERAELIAGMQQQLLTSPPPENSPPPNTGKSLVASRDQETAKSERVCSLEEFEEFLVFLEEPISPQQVIPTVEERVEKSLNFDLTLTDVLVAAGRATERAAAQQVERDQKFSPDPEVALSVSTLAATHCLPRQNFHKDWQSHGALLSDTSVVESVFPVSSSASTLVLGLAKAEPASPDSIPEDVAPDLFDFLLQTGAEEDEVDNVTHAIQITP